MTLEDRDSAEYVSREGESTGSQAQTVSDSQRVDVTAFDFLVL